MSDIYFLFSHDEVVHGKGTIIEKMWGHYEDKFKQCRALYLYMYTHPGKKLNFMGNEMADFRWGGISSIARLGTTEISDA